MYPEADDVSEYLVSDAIVDWQTPAVREKALELTRSLPDEVAKARCLYEWVRDAISHTADAGLEIQRAIERWAHLQRLRAGRAVSMP